MCNGWRGFEQHRERDAAYIFEIQEEKALVGQFGFDLYFYQDFTAVTGLSRRM